MNLNAVAMFVCVVQTGSFSQASARLHIPLATVSRNIGELEKSLNVSLLIRAKTGVVPTVAGQRFYEQCRHSIDQLQLAERNVLNDEQMLNGQLRIATPPLFVPAWELMAAFAEKHPHVRLHCLTGGQLADFFADGIDVAFRLGNLHTDNVIAKTVMRTETVLAATPDFIRRFGRPQQLLQLSNFPCAAWSADGQFRQPKIFINELPLLNMVFTSNDLQAVRHYVLSGLAIGMLPPYAVAGELAAGTLVEVLPDEPKQAYDVRLIYPASRHQSAVLKAFVAFCLENSKQAA